MGLMALLCPTGVAAQSADSLNTYIEAAIRNNPAVIGQYRAYQAQVMAAHGEGQLGDPTFSVGVSTKPMDNVNTKEIATFSIMQMFPWFGTLKAGRQMAEHKAEATYQKFREDGIALAFDVQRQWYTILATQEKVRRLGENLKVLEDIEKVALYKYKSPSMGMTARMSDQLRLQSEEAAVKEQISSMQALLALQKQQLNIVMNREPESPLVIPDTIVLRQMPVVSWDDVERLDPMLQKFVAEGKAAEAQDRKAKGMGLPMIGLGVEYMLNGKVKMPMMESMNGMDMVMPMVTVSLPIYRRKTNAARKAATMMKESTVLGYQGRQDALRSQYLSISQRAEDEQRKIALYDEQTEILNNTLRLMATEYANGTSSLTDILQTTRQQIDYALKKAEAVARYNTIVAEYEKLASRHDFAVRSDI